MFHYFFGKTINYINKHFKLTQEILSTLIICLEFHFYEYIHKYKNYK